MFSVIQRWLAIGALILALISGSSFYFYEKGIQHQKDVYAAATVKADDKIVQKNDTLQQTADTTDKQQIVYRDRIVTKFQTVNKEVVKYVESKDAHVGLDPEFVRLHDNAARANGQSTIAESASRPDGQAAGSGVTTGAAIGVITRNYQTYYECARRLSGLQDFYLNLQNQVNASATTPQ